MSTASSTATPHEHLEQAPLPSLSMEEDPSGLTERAPALASLLPDEALSLALARGDTHAVHAVLILRLELERPGPTRDTLEQLLGQPELFAVSETPPRLGEVLGTGFSLVQLPAQDQRQTPFIATRALRVLGVPLWPLSQHLVRQGQDGQLEVLGRVPASSLGAWRAASFLAMAGVLIAGVGAGLLPLALHEVHVVNGLSRPVEVRLDDHVVTVDPGTVAKEQVFSLTGVDTVEARWPGESTPFEVLPVEDLSSQAVYNVLGAASVQVDDPEEPDAPRPLLDALGNLESGEELTAWKGGWEQTVREHADARRWEQATAVAQGVALADPTALRAREEALRWTLRFKKNQAEQFLLRLVERYPDDASAHHLFQDAFLAMGWSQRSRMRYEKWAQEAPDSAFRALLHARILPPEEQPQAYSRVLERFPAAAEARLEMARIHIGDGALEQGLELLGEVPASLESVELRVRALISAKRLREASNAVRQFANDPRHLSWELAVMAGQLDRLAGPSRAQYVTHDLIPAALAKSPEHMVAFALLTGESTVKDEELKAIIDPTAREALELTREMTRDLKKATERATTVRDSVLSQLPQEAAAVLALELSRTGNTEAAQRVFGSQLALWLAREPLENLLRTGEESYRMSLLPPGLHAAAHLVYARGLKAGQREEQDKALHADVLGGFARRTLDPGYSEYTPVVLPSVRPWRARGCAITIIRGSSTPSDAQVRATGETSD